MNINKCVIFKIKVLYMYRYSTQNKGVLFENKGVLLKIKVLYLKIKVYLCSR